jgi:TonB family protein
MAPTVLENLARWNAQIVVLTAVAAVLVHLLRVNAPVIRHAFWRLVLLTCLALPLVQPWRAPGIDASVESFEAALSAPPAGLSATAASGGPSPFLALATRHVRANWVSYVVIFLGTGIVLRLAWLLIGIHRLHRLRRAGVLAATDAGYRELAALTEAGAEIRRVQRLGQPVTFGMRKPVVLLPASFPELPEGVQRAVLAHELWHVRRRDWAWVLLEEGIRSFFWCNPAMWWLISRVQSSREEVVDELTVQLTNARKTYLEALLVFADQPTLFPAAPFGRRRHLFHRMLLISREAVMSSRRIVASSIAMGAVLLATGLYASSAFPLKAVPAASTEPEAQNPPRDRRPGEAGPETARERELKKAIAGAPATPEQFIELAKLQEARGATSEAEATLQAAARSPHGNRDALMTLAGFYNRSGQFDRAVAILADAAAMNPSDPQGYQILATFYWEKAFKDTALSPAQKGAYIQSGIEATDRALAADDSYVDALTYKNILLRMKANMESDAGSKQALVAEADALRNRAMELQKARQSGRSDMAFVPAPGQPPPPPPPPPPAELVDGQAPIRVGGNIKPPMKVRDVKPVYPADAMAARVRGVVIIEATIDPLGNVINTRVMRGQPLLDQAAVEAVSQWQFAPTLLNGVAVPVIMTVTVNFTMDRGALGPDGQAALMPAPPPPPPPPPAGFDGQAPVRVGGNIKPPRKLRDVKPFYPEEAKADGVQGLVIIEATIDPLGNVASARVLKSVPALDQAALEAVQQWQYDPTLVNGVAVPVIMTVTVNFTLQ